MKLGSFNNFAQLASCSIIFSKITPPFCTWTPSQLSRDWELRFVSDSKLYFFRKALLIYTVLFRLYDEDLRVEVFYFVCVYFRNWTHGCIFMSLIPKLSANIDTWTSSQLSRDWELGVVSDSKLYFFRKALFMYTVLLIQTVQVPYCRVE